ncbi:MFS general substrate transporter [Gloeophyllum trabeum ATCC 11539]|uniref:MFS general substrate transporter n=1 Tax=Gloeophyllum trabeum (strain ATCC 11539 / FP-39264 / Madison 617) TaxID=670483 RepID=S7QKH7_GLOTA|nr:MFS general substrate transporter [Gloeophyllum trabeum ATCC 11539]EPQ59892.1 MFS general substrate transporter [Gloeophyllum trabeum ATCC 11539]
MSVLCEEVFKQEVSADVEVDSPDQGLERRLLRKLDWVLLPLFTVTFILNFIDRTAIGNAKIAGIEKDLRLAGYEYNVALTVFYICYILSEVPSNLALKHFGSIWLAFIVTAFGVITIASAFTRDFAGLLVTRIFLGAAEGGTLPGLTYVMSRYYRREELVLRVGVVLGLAPTFAGAFGGLLASGLLSMNDIGTVTSWRKIFLVEGIITSGFGLLCFMIIPDDPQRSRLLSPEERSLAMARIAADQVVSTTGRKERTTWRLVLRAFNFNTTLCAICFLMLNISFQGLSLYMPTVVATLGHFTTVESQLRTVPPYVVGAAWVVINTYFSYRIKQRGFPICISVLLMVTGYAIFIGTKDSRARYAACFLSIAGGSPTIPMFVAWGVDNAAPDTVRAVTTAIIPGIGALGSIIAVWTYLPSDAPDYHEGNSLNLATSSAVCVLALIGVLYIKYENQKRASGARDYRLEGLTQQELEELGYLHPSFRYQS